MVVCVGGSLQPPSITDKVKEVFGLSEVNPNSKNLGPNEVGQEAIDRITPNASSFDKAAPGAPRRRAHAAQRTATGPCRQAPCCSLTGWGADEEGFGPAGVAVGSVHLLLRARRSVCGALRARQRARRMPL